MVRTSLAFVACLLLASSSFAQVHRGTIEFGGITSVAVNRQSLTPDDNNPDGALNITNTTAGVNTAFYTSERFGVGALVQFTSFAVEAPDGSEAFKTSASFAGPLMKYRVDLGERADFVFAAGGGVARMTFGAAPDATDYSGFFVTGGGTVAVFLNDRTSFDVGVRYQRSQLKNADSDVQTVADGIVLGLGFSLYLN